MATCKDAKELQLKIQKNLVAIETMVPNVRECVEDIDEDGAAEWSENVLSATRGFIQLLREAKEKKILILNCDT